MGAAVVASYIFSHLALKRGINLSTCVHCDAHTQTTPIMAPDINSSGENALVEAGRRFLRSWGLVKNEHAPSPAVASPPNLDGHSDLDPFAQARDQFLHNLPDDAREVFAAGCSSASALRKEMQTLLANSSHFHQAHRASKLLQRIQGLSDRLEPYFAIVSIVVSSNPEYAAIVWGALRLLLVLGRNFGDFFEKLSLTIERIAAHFPQYAALLRHAEGLGSASDAFKNSLRAIYTDVLEFFASAAGIFVTDRGDKIGIEPTSRTPNRQCQHGTNYPLRETKDSCCHGFLDVEAVRQTLPAYT